MDNISTQLSDLAIARSLVLQRVANGLSNDVAILYNEMIDDISTTILKSGKISNHLTKTIKDIKAQLQVPDINDNLKDIAQAEVNYTQKAYNSVIGIDLFKNVPPEGAMASILNTSLIEGAVLKDWMNDLSLSQAFDVERAIKLGVTLGETNYQIAQRLKNTLEIAQRNAQTIVITATSSIANTSRMEFYKENEEVIRGYEHSSTLDSKTTFICASRDGSVWDTNGKPLNAKAKGFKMQTPPLHMRCRSVLIPVLKSWKEMGFDLEELPIGTRSSLDGYLPQNTTFEQWLKTKDKVFLDDYLGKGRAELYKSGKITLKDLINQQGKTLSIAKLKEKYS